jgi:hypothetical protein
MSITSSATEPAPAARASRSRASGRRCGRRSRNRSDASPPARNTSSGSTSGNSRSLARPAREARNAATQGMLRSGTGRQPPRRRCRRHISGNGSRGLDDTVGLAAVGNQASHAMPTRRVPGTTCKSVWATAYVFLGGAPPVPKPSTACAGAQQCQPVRMETGSERKPTARDRSARDRCSARSHVLISRRTVADDEGIARLLRTTPDRHRLATAGFRFAWRSARPARVARRERCSSNSRAARYSHPVSANKKRCRSRTKAGAPLSARRRPESSATEMPDIPAKRVPSRGLAETCVSARQASCQRVLERGKPGLTRLRRLTAGRGN